MTPKPARKMKVVDFHLHVGKREHWNPAIHKLFQKLNPGLYEIQDEVMTPENIVGMLDSSGVDWAIILAEISPQVTGVVTNEFVATFCEKHLDRLIPFCSVDPTEDPNPAKTLEHAVRTLGMRGLKLYPTYQHFYPNAYTTSEDWEKIKKNQNWIIQFASLDDPFIPIEQSRHIHKVLDTEYYEYKDQKHFGSEHYSPKKFPDLLEKLLEKLNGNTRTI